MKNPLNRRSSPIAIRTRPSITWTRLSKEARLNTVFSALSDPTRRAMLERLSQGEVSAGELARPFQITLPAVSKHLHVLEDAGLVSRRKNGRKHILALDPLPLRATAEWIDTYQPLWDAQLKSLEQHLKNEDS